MRCVFVCVWYLDAHTRFARVYVRVCVEGSNDEPAFNHNLRRIAKTH